MKNYIFLLLLIAGSASLYGQDIALFYEVKGLTEEQHVLEIYMQSMSDEEVTVSAVNFSLALPAGCVEVKGQKSFFAESWTSYLEHVELIPNLNQTYGDWHYSHRWQYGNADPRLANTPMMLAPSQNSKALKVMEIHLAGSCVDQIYLEHQQENSLNQMADGDLKKISWAVIHPDTELAIQEDIGLNIFPNPVSDVLNLSFEGQGEETFLVELRSMDGRNLMMQTLDTKARDNLQFNMTGLPSAAYMLTISNSNPDVNQIENVTIIKK